MRVLVIDDDDMVRYGARIVLESDGYEVVAVASGAEGLELVNGGFDAVLCDFEMPGVSGLGVWRGLSEEMKSRFVLWTGRPDLVEGTSFPVLAKPVSNAELREAIRRVAG